MSEFIEGNNVTTKLAQEVQQELPTIYVSVKNLIACALGKNYEVPQEPKMQPQNVMTCAKYLLQAIRSYPLPDVEQFCEEHPQPDDQLGVDRLEDICKYKVIHALRYKAEEKGGKITRLFGKSYIQWSKMWTSFRRTTVELIQENTHIPMEEIEFFLRTYEASLDLEDQPEGMPSNEKLIWATDFNAVLSEMQKERHQRVDTRQRATPDDISSLESQLFAPAGASSSRSRNGSQATTASYSSDISASRQSSQGSINLQNLTFNQNNQIYNNVPLGELNPGPFDPRGRATTMEQLGLEPPLHEPLQRCISHDTMHNYDRSRATTLDLFAYEQQSLALSQPHSMTPSPKAGALRTYRSRDRSSPESR